MTRAGRRVDRRADAREEVVVEDRVELLDVAVEVQRAAHGGEEVVRLDGVVHARAELDRTGIEDEHAGERVLGGLGETVDDRAARIEGQRAGAGLDHGSVSVGGAVAAVERGGEGQIAERPDVERRVAVGLLDHSSRDRGGAARTVKDTTRAQGELSASRKGQGGAAVDGQRIRGDIRRERGTHAVEEQVVVRRVGVGGTVVVFRAVERADERVVRGTAAEVVDRGEGSAVSGRGAVDEGPREDAVRGVARGGARLTIEGRATVEHDRRDVRRGHGSHLGAAEEHGSAGLAAGLDRSHVVGLAAELEPGLVVGVVGRERDDRVTAREGRRVEVLGGVVARAGRTADEVQVATAEGDTVVGSVALFAETALRGVHRGVVERERRTGVDEQGGAPAARDRQILGIGAGGIVGDRERNSGRDGGDVLIGPDGATGERSEDRRPDDQAGRIEVVRRVRNDLAARRGHGAREGDAPAEHGRALAEGEGLA